MIAADGRVLFHLLISPRIQKLWYTFSFPVPEQRLQLVFWWNKCNTFELYFYGQWRHYEGLSKQIAAISNPWRKALQDQTQEY